MGFTQITDSVQIAAVTRKRTELIDEYHQAKINHVKQTCRLVGILLVYFSVAFMTTYTILVETTSIDWISLYTISFGVGWAVAVLGKRRTPGLNRHVSAVCKFAVSAAKLRMHCAMNVRLQNKRGWVSTVTEEHERIKCQVSVYYCVLRQWIFMLLISFLVGCIGAGMYMSTVDHAATVFALGGGMLSVAFVLSTTEIPLCAVFGELLKARRELKQFERNHEQIENSIWLRNA
jgi:hypothetical protein